MKRCLKLSAVLSLLLATSATMLAQAQQERVKGFGGKLEIFSGRTGTTIKIMVPLSSADLRRAQAAS